MNCKWEMDTQVLIENCSPPSFLNDSSPLLWQKFEKKFKSEKAAGSVSKSTQFEYAWCLVRSKYNDDIRKGIALLEGEVLVYRTHPFPSAVRVCSSVQQLVVLSLHISSAGILFQHGALQYSQFIVIFQ